MSGCGRRATYVESCDAPAGTVTRQCTWVMNVVSNPQSGVSAENEVTSEAEKPKDLPPAGRKKATRAAESAADDAEPELPSKTSESETASAAVAEGSAPTAPTALEDAGAELANEAKKPRKKRKPPMTGF